MRLMPPKRNGTKPRNEAASIPRDGISILEPRSIRCYRIRAFPVPFSRAGSRSSFISFRRRILHSSAEKPLVSRRDSRRLPSGCTRRAISGTGRSRRSPPVSSRYLPYLRKLIPLRGRSTATATEVITIHVPGSHIMYREYRPRASSPFKVKKKKGISVLDASRLILLPTAADY